MVHTQNAELQKKRITGIIPAGKGAGFFQRFMKRALRKIPCKLSVKTADLVLGELGVIPDQFIDCDIKISCKLEKEQNIRHTLGIFPLGYGSLGHTKEIRQFLLCDLPPASETDYIVR